MGDDLDAEIAKAQQARGTGFADIGADDDVYTKDRFAGFEGSIAAGDEEEDDGDDARPVARKTFTAPAHLLDVPQQDSEDPLAAQQRSNRIADREDEYHARRQRVLSPSRADAFALGDQTPDASVRSYKDVMAEQQVARERDEIRRKLRSRRRLARARRRRNGGDGACPRLQGVAPRRR